MDSGRPRPTLTLTLEGQQGDTGRLLSPSEVSPTPGDRTPPRKTLSFLPSPRSPRDDRDGDASLEEEGRNAAQAAKRKSRAAKAPVARGKLECRKLLGHLLDSTQRSVEKVAWYTQGQRTAQADSDDEGASTRAKGEGAIVDGIFEVVVQLRDVVIFSERMGWSLFFSTDAFGEQQSPASPRGRLFMSTPPASPLPSSPTSRYSGTALLDSAVALLERLALLANNHTVSRFRPSTPPLALQSVVLDLAMIMHKVVAGRPREVIMVGQAVLPGLEGWGPAIRARLLGFYDQVLQDCLQGVERAKRHRLSGASTSETVWSRGPPSQMAAPAIQIDAPTESFDVNGQNGRSRATTKLIVGDRAVVSSYAAEQSGVTYQLSSLVAPVLAAALSSFEGSSSPWSLVSRHHDLIESLVKLKEDLYNDLLDIVAYGTSSMRHAALSALNTFWPQAVGHAHVTSPLPRLRFSDDAWRSQTGQQHLPPAPSEQLHQYLPWAFAGAPEYPKLQCGECGQAIEGFGLLCVSGGHAPLHLQCYSAPEGYTIVHHVTSTGMKVAAARYSVIPPSRRSLLLTPGDVSEADKAQTATALMVKQHPLRLCNLFSVSLCFVCTRPLWGTIKQAFKCSRCHQFAHRACLLRSGVPNCTASDERPVEEVCIDWLAMRKDWLAFYGGMVLSEDRLATVTHEELAIFYSVLWIQLQLLEAGIASGTIVVVDAPATPEFELHALVVRYGEWLVTKRLSRSSALDDFSNAMGEHEANRILFSWDLLSFVNTIMRAPAVGSDTTSGGLLSVSQTATTGDPVTEQTFELMQVSLMRDILARDFGIRNELASRWLLDWMQSTRLFFERVDGHLAHTETSRPCVCSFPLPLLIDSTLTVETLIIAIEQCLREPDLAVQEAGFLLLARRCQPTGFSSNYALGRLAGAVIGWLVTEEALFAAAIAHSRSKRLPEISGATYQAARGKLASTYATPWLYTLHELDHEAYATTLFEGLASQAAVSEPPGATDDEQEERRTAFADTLVRYMYRLAGSGVMFSAFDLLLGQWLDECVGQLANSDDKPLALRSVIRLFRLTDEIGSHSHGRDRTGSLGKLDMERGASSMGPTELNPWRCVHLALQRDAAGLAQACGWLSLLARAGVAIQLETLQAALDTAKQLAAPFIVFGDLATAIFFTTIVRQSNGESLVQIACGCLTAQQEHLLDAASSPNPGHAESVRDRLIRHLLGATLLASNRPVDELRELSLISPADHHALAQRRRRTSHQFGLKATASLPSSAVATLARLAASDDFGLRAVVVKFLYVLLASPSAMDDSSRLIEKHSDALAACIYRSFDPLQSSLASIRMPLLLRLLAVAPSSFIKLIDALKAVELWEARWTALDTIFQILLEAIDAVADAKKQGKEQLMSVVAFVFSALWDVEEPLRQKAGVMVDSLQPMHLAAVSNIVQARLSSADLVGKLDVCALLLQLRGRLPAWQALPWWTVTSEMFDLDDVEKKHDPLVAEELRLSLVSLALSYIAASIDISARDVQFVKYHVARLLGFEVALGPVGPEGETGVDFRSVDVELPAAQRFGCLFDLKRVLDCAKLLYRDQTTVLTDATRNVPLIGLEFADLILRLITSELPLANLPYTHLRSLLDCLLVIVFKQDIASRPHLPELLATSLKRVIELLLEPEMAHEIRLLVLAIVQATLRQLPTLVIPLLGQQISFCLAMMASQLDDRGAEFSAAKSFLQTAFTTYGASGLFVLIFKILPTPEKANDEGHRVFAALKFTMLDGNDVTDETRHTHTMRDLPVLDISLSLLGGHNKRSVISSVLQNLAAYVTHCHDGPFESDVVEALALFITRFSRTLTDWRWDEIDLCHLLDIATAAVKSSRPAPPTLITAVDMLLRASMHRFPFSKSSLSALFIALGDVLRPHKSDIEPGKGHHSHGHIGGTGLIFLNDGLSGRSVPLVSLTSLLEIVYDELGAVKPIRFARIVLPEAMSALELASRLARFLLTRPGDERLTRVGFGTWNAAAKLWLGLARRETQVWQTAQGLNGLDHIRFNNLLSLATLDMVDISTTRSLLARSTDRLGLALSSTPSIIEDGGEVVAQIAAHVQLWHLVIRSAYPEDGQERAKLEAGWWLGSSGAWAALERLLEAAEPADDGSLTPLKMVVWTTFADLVLFLHRAESSLIVTEASAWASWLRALSLRPKDPASSKFLRALEALTGESPAPSTREALLAQTKNDAYAAFKLRIWSNDLRKG